MSEIVEKRKELKGKLFRKMQFANAAQEKFFKDHPENCTLGAAMAPEGSDLLVSESKSIQDEHQFYVARTQDAEADVAFNIERSIRLFTQMKQSADATIKEVRRRSNKFKEMLSFLESMKSMMPTESEESKKESK